MVIWFIRYHSETISNEKIRFTALIRTRQLYEENETNQKFLDWLARWQRYTEKYPKIPFFNIEARCSRPRRPMRSNYRYGECFFNITKRSAKWDQDLADLTCFSPYHRGKNIFLRTTKKVLFCKHRIFEIQVSKA